MRKIFFTSKYHCGSFNNWFTACILTVALISFAQAQEVKYPAYHGYVNDYARVMAPADVNKLTNLIGELESKTSAQVAVVTLDSIKPLTVETYAVELFQNWGIGQKDKDNGVLILVAVKDRRMRIEAGYGLEGALPDARCGQIINTYMVPYFKQGDYSEGIIQGALAVIDTVAREYGVTLSDASPLPRKNNQRSSPAAGFLSTFFTIILFILIFGTRLGLFGYLLLGSGRRRGGYWYGGGYHGNSGGFGGGFGGFGGGLSGGGGASGSW